MNLIEMLGGYEAAKLIVDKAPCKTYTYHNHPYQKGYIRCWGSDGKEYFLVSDIEKALLNYRRENNIFEVGDKVIYLLLGNEVIYYNDWLKTQNNNLIRHATDEEIKAGRRL